MRCGHAYAEGAVRYGRTHERHFVRQVRSTIFWGLLLPLLVLGLAWPTRGVSAVLLSGYLLLYWRTERDFRLGRRWPASYSRPYAAFCVLGKFPELVGVLKYASRRIRGGPARIIEYRGTAAVPTIPQAKPEPVTHNNNRRSTPRPSILGGGPDASLPDRRTRS